MIPLVMQGYPLTPFKYRHLGPKYALGKTPLIFTFTASDNQNVTLNFTDASNYTVDWGDGTVTTDTLEHTYATAGSYTITYTGLASAIDLQGLDVTDVAQLGYLGCTSFDKAFYNIGTMESFKSAPCDTSNVTNMRYMMDKWTSMTSPPDLSNLNTSKVTNMRYTMAYWTSMTTPPDLSSFDTSNVTTMYAMMVNWTSMTTPPDFSSFDTSNVTTMYAMMANWTSMTTPPDLSSFDTSNVTNMHAMMTSWTSMTTPPDLSSFDTSNVTNMGEMLFNWSSMTTPPDLSSFDTSNVTNMNYMVSGWSSMGEVGDIGVENFNIGSLTDAGNFAKNTTFATSTYDKILVNWQGQPHNQNVTVHFGNSKYTPGSAAETARNSLINDDGWTITDGGPA